MVYDLPLTRMLSTSVNGCSMKTEAQLEMIKMIPLEKLLLETGTQAPHRNGSIITSLLSDAPWCSLTGGHASRAHLGTLPLHLHDLYIPPATQPDRWQEGKAVKGRNEPCAIGAVAHVVAQ
jgi:TatD DNase family protein